MRSIACTIEYEYLGIIVEVESVTSRIVIIVEVAKLCF
jgi:hypothetical protein